MTILPGSAAGAAALNIYIYISLSLSLSLSPIIYMCSLRFPWHPHDPTGPHRESSPEGFQRGATALQDTAHRSLWSLRRWATLSDRWMVDLHLGDV